MSETASSDIGRARRILAIRFGSLGDVLLTMPLLTAIGSRCPEARVDYLTRKPFEPLAGAHPVVDRVHTLAGGGLRGDIALGRHLGAEDYDLVIDLHGNPRSRLVSLLTGAPIRRRLGGARRTRRRLVWEAHWRRWRGSGRPPELARIEPVAIRAARLIDPGLDREALPALQPQLGPGLRARLDDAEQRELARIDRALPGLRIALCPGAQHATKCWPDTAYAELADRLVEAGAGVLVALGQGDEAPALIAAAARRPDRIEVLRGSLPLLGAGLGLAGAAVGNDSGLTHLAVAVGVPAVVLFGPTVPELGFIPAGRHRVVERLDLGCRPCAVHGGARCPRGDHACLDGIGAGEVLAALDAWSMLPSGAGVAAPVTGASRTTEATRRC